MPCRLWAYLELIDSLPVVHFRIGFFSQWDSICKTNCMTLVLISKLFKIILFLTWVAFVQRTQALSKMQITRSSWNFFFFFFGRCSNPGYVNSYFMNSCKSLKTYDFIHSFPFGVLFMVQQSKFHKLLQNSWGE